MPNRRWCLLACAATPLTLLLLTPAAIPAASAATRLAIIVNSRSSFTDIDLGALRQLFKGERVSIGGTRLIALNHPPGTIDRINFDRVVLGMSPSDVSKYWIDRRIRGLSGPPRSVESADLLQRAVDRLPGAVAYLRPQQIRSDVRVLTLDGKHIHDPDYPVQF